MWVPTRVWSAAKKVSPAAAVGRFARSHRRTHTTNTTKSSSSIQAAVAQPLGELLKDLQTDVHARSSAELAEERMSSVAARITLQPGKIHQEEGVRRTTQPTSSTRKTTRTMQQQNDDELTAYDPLIPASLVSTVAAVVNPSRAVQLARELLRTVSTGDDDHGVLPSSSSSTTCDEEARRGENLLRRLATVVERWRAQRTTNTATQKQQRRGVHVRTMEEMAELECGIVGKLHNNHTRLRAFVADVGDVQLNEVLEDGRVVCFTSATLPDDVVDGRVRSATMEAMCRHEGQHVLPLAEELALARKDQQLTINNNNNNDDGGDDVVRMHLHFVLYRERTSLADVFQRLAELSDGELCCDAFSVQHVLDDHAASVQVCCATVHLRTPHNNTNNVDEDGAQRLHQLTRQLCRVNLHPHRFSMEVLWWSASPTLTSRPRANPKHITASRPTTQQRADAHAARVQYSLLLRGLRRRGGRLEALAQQHARSFINFYAPTHFGPVLCPFKTFYVDDAMNRGEEDAAVLMAVVMHLWQQLPREGTSSSSSSSSAVDHDGWMMSVPTWVRAACVLLAEGERARPPAAYRAWWLRTLPQHVRLFHERGVSDLLWNVAASGRLRHARSDYGAGATPESLMLPQVGDFVVCNNDGDDGVGVVAMERSTSVWHLDAGAKAEAAALLPHGSVSTSSGVALPPNVRLLVESVDATQCSLHDVVIPRVDVGASKCPAMEQLAEDLGFGRRRGRSHAHNMLAPSSSSSSSSRANAFTNFRPFLASASGSPHSLHPWVRELVEPSMISHQDAMHDDEGGNNNNAHGGVLVLQTDLRLSSSGEMAATDFAASSRGPRAAMWPISRRGRLLTDRLPAGFLATKAMTSAPAQRHATKTLAMHLTLPANVYCWSFLREVVVIEQQ